MVAERVGASRLRPSGDPMIRKSVLSIASAFSILACKTPQQAGAKPVVENEGESTTQPCASDLSSCPIQGCAAVGTDAAAFNELKHGTSNGTANSATAVTVEMLVRLQSGADALGIQRRDFSASTRDKLRSLSLDGKPLGEGAWVRLAGYIVAAPNDPQHHHGAHPNTGESVNCNLHAPAENDYHIPIVPQPGGAECQSITAEMLPQGRPARWNLALLHDDLPNRPALVMVVGPLFYDNAHDVDSDCSRPSTGNPKRVSLFEVHPVREFYVCPDTSCSVDSLSGWQQLQ